MDLFNNINCIDFLLHCIYSLPYIYIFYIYYDVNIKLFRNIIVEKVCKIDIKNENVITEIQLLRQSIIENSKSIENISKTVKKMIEK
jgi:hypothetical protein